MKINVNYVPSIHKVKLFWMKADRAGIYGIAEWESKDFQCKGGCYYIGDTKVESPTCTCDFDYDEERDYNEAF